MHPWQILSSGQSMKATNPTPCLSRDFLTPRRAPPSCSLPWACSCFWPCYVSHGTVLPAMINFISSIQRIPLYFIGFHYSTRKLILWRSCLILISSGQNTQAETQLLSTTPNWRQPQLSKATHESQEQGAFHIVWNSHGHFHLIELNAPFQCSFLVILAKGRALIII